MILRTVHYRTSSTLAATLFTGMGAGATTVGGATTPQHTVRYEQEQYRREYNTTDTTVPVVPVVRYGPTVPT